MQFENIDIDLLKWIHSSSQNEFFDHLLPILRNKFTWVPLYIYFGVYLIRKQYTWACIGAIFCVAMSDLFCSQLLKECFERMRPCYSLSNEHWFREFGLCSSTYSFPSCHTLNHAAISAFLWHFFNNKYRWLFILWVFTIGYSQVYIGVHYPSDVLVGGLIGGMFGNIIYKAYAFILVKIKECKIGIK